MTEEDVSGAAHVSQSLKKVLDKLDFGEPIQAHVVRGILSPEGDSQ